MILYLGILFVVFKVDKKVRAKNLKKVLFIVSILSTFFSCQEEDFAVEATFPLTLTFPLNENQKNRCAKIESINFHEAKAKVVLTQSDGATEGMIVIKGGLPNTIYSAWISLDRPNPLTGKYLTPLVNPEDMHAMADVTHTDELKGKASFLGWKGVQNAGSDDVSILKNAFRTDSTGRGVLKFHLNFKLLGGNYPYSAIDKSLSDVKINNLNTQNNQVFSIVTNCETNLGYGLVDRTPHISNELWFKFKYKQIIVFGD